MVVFIKFSVKVFILREKRVPTRHTEENAPFPCNFQRSAAAGTELVCAATVPPPSVKVTGLSAFLLHRHKQDTGPFAVAVFEAELQCILIATLRQDPPNQRQRRMLLLRP